MNPALIDALRRVPLFAALDDAALGEISSLVGEFEAEAGHVLIERGQPATGVFLIEEGAVTVTLPDGQRIERGEGTFFGELSVLAETPRTARVTVARELRCLAIRRDDLIALLEREPSISLAMLRELARRLIEVSGAG